MKVGALVALFLLASGVGAKESRCFSGAWITDEEMAAKEPRRVTCRALERKNLPPLDASVQNKHILFRRTFNLEKLPKEAHVFITADDYYKLYVNGRFVGQGPAPGFPEHTYYNEIDVTPVLRSGRNVLAVHTYYQGLVNRVWVSGDNRHGLLLDLVADGQCVVASDRSFLTHRHGGYSQIGKVGYDTQFLERYDAAAPEVGFEDPTFDDSSWPTATLHPHGGDYRTFPQLSALLELETIRPVRCETVSNGLLRVDFGGIYVGYPHFAAKGLRGSVVTIRCGQELRKDGSVRCDLRANCRYVEEMILSGADRDELRQFDYKSFRYLELSYLPGVEIDLDSIFLTARHLPFKLRARPNFCDDPALLNIWRLCVDSFRYGVQEQIMDCMEREKGYYLGDGCYTTYAYCLLTKDWSHARRFMDDFLRTREIDRGLMCCANCSFMQECAEYPLMLFLLARAYLEETGDVGFIRDRWQAFANVLDCYRERYAREDGLICNLDKWCVVEWPKNYQDGYDVDLDPLRIVTETHAVINAWYIGAIKCMNAMSKLVGCSSYADVKPLEAAFVRAFWDPERKLFVDREGSRHISLPGNTYSAFFGLEPESEQDVYRKNFLALVKEKGFSSINLFQYVPVFAYLKMRGEDLLLHEMLVSSETWSRMLREGATRTFEGWGKDTKWNTSLFHLTMAAGAIFLCDSAIVRVATFPREN